MIGIDRPVYLLLLFKNHYILEDSNVTVPSLTLDNGSTSHVTNETLQKIPLQGTIFFLNLPEQTAAVIQNVERVICKKGALISDFLYIKVTHIIVHRKNPAKSTRKARQFYSPSTRSVLMVQISLKKTGNLRNSLNCLEQAKRFGIKIIYLSELLNPNFNWYKYVDMKAKYVRTWIDEMQN